MDGPGRPRAPHDLGQVAAKCPSSSRLHLAGLPIPQFAPGASPKANRHYGADKPGTVDRGCLSQRGRASSGLCALPGPSSSGAALARGSFRASPGSEHFRLGRMHSAAQLASALHRRLCMLLLGVYGYRRPFSPRSQPQQGRCTGHPCSLSPAVFPLVEREHEPQSKKGLDGLPQGSPGLQRIVGVALAEERVLPSGASVFLLSLLQAREGDLDVGPSSTQNPHTLLSTNYRAEFRLTDSLFKKQMPMGK